MTGRRGYVSCAAQGSLVGLGLCALLAAAAWLLSDALGPKGFAALLWLAFLGVPAVALAAMLAVPLMVLHDRRLERRRAVSAAVLGDFRSPLGGGSTPAEGVGAHPGSAGYGVSPCVAAPPHGVSRPNHLRHMAEQIEATGYHGESLPPNNPTEEKP